MRLSLLLSLLVAQAGGMATASGADKPDLIVVGLKEYASATTYVDQHRVVHVELKIGSEPQITLEPL
ncbi:MAG: hypothetical protein ACYTFI_27100, partial [Planctomycetota bacterium]